MEGTLDRLGAITVFLAAIDGGSLSAAGRKLGMPLATVSRKVSDLEAHLGTRLLVRSTRALSLTDAGQAYAAACRRILAEVEDAEREAAGEYRSPKGDLIVTAPIVLGRLHLLPIVTRFLAAFPHVNVQLELGDRLLSIWEERIDLALRIGHLPDSTLVATPVGRVRQVVCASPEYLRRHGTPRRPGDLARYDCVTFDALSPGGSWTFGEGRARASVQVRARLRLNTAESALDAAIAGAGITRLLSYQVRGALNAGSLTRVLARYEPEAVPVSLIYGSQKPLPLKVRAFVDFAVPRLRQGLSPG